MIKTGRLYTLLVLLLALASCSQVPQASNRYTYDTTVDFTQFRTFNWYRAEVPKPRAGAGPQFNLLLDQRVREAIASELVKQGLRPEVENPDLIVAYDLAVDSSQAPKDYTFPAGFGYGYSHWFGYRFRYTTTGLADYQPIQALPLGTLVIDIIDPDTNRLLWRGYSEAGINPTSQDMERINLAVADVMSQFPPNPIKRNR
ncbi:DUF4136 domain-containing protein [Pontibacter flavimaris]|uniref:DUF4136 domain-containing protein n=1 Tax=Pontibacter flavimaris TaxID=1797110 RepID=UPI00093B1FA2|nr:DUF4136 domain-containing protein [Pontibacter flavimaris]